MKKKDFASQLATIDDEAEIDTLVEASFPGLVKTKEVIKEVKVDQKLEITAGELFKLFQNLSEKGGKYDEQKSNKSDDTDIYI